MQARQHFEMRRSQGKGGLGAGDEKKGKGEGEEEDQRTKYWHPDPTINRFMQWLPQQCHCYVPLFRAAKVANVNAARYYHLHRLKHEVGIKNMTHISLAGLRPKLKAQA